MKPEIKEGNVVFSKKDVTKVPFCGIIIVGDDFVLICDGDRERWINQSGKGANICPRRRMRRPKSSRFMQ